MATIYHIHVAYTSIKFVLFFDHYCCFLAQIYLVNSVGVWSVSNGNINAIIVLSSVTIKTSLHFPTLTALQITEN